MKKPRPINEMKCPFMIDEKGEFMPCLGDCCMAYFEYEYAPLAPMNSKTEPVIIRQCRRLGCFTPIY